MKQDNKLASPFEKICHELWILLASASGDTAKTQELLEQPTNWDLLLRLAVYHRVYPLVYKMLNELNNPAIPKCFLNVMQKENLKNTMRALSMTGETIRIVKHFESQGIRIVVLKGAPLACHLYSDIAIRPSSDIDILVPPEELGKAYKILKNEGYLKINNEHILTPRQLQKFLKTFSDNYHFTYLHSKRNILLEIHWELGNYVHGFPFPTESTIQRIRIAGSSLPVLSNEEWLLYLMSHGAIHAWTRLRWLVDIAKFMQREDIDWIKVSFLARKIGIQPVLHQSLILAHNLLAVPVPPVFLKALSRDRSAWRLTRMALKICLSDANYKIGRSNDLYIEDMKSLYGFYVRAGWKRRFVYILNLFNPTINDIKLISIPDKLCALYYIIRPFTLFSRRLRKFRMRN